MKIFIQMLLMGLFAFGMLTGLTMIESQAALFWQGTGLLMASFGLLCMTLHRSGLMAFAPYLSSSVRQE